MSIKIERYQNVNRKSTAFGKTFGRIVYEKKVMDIRRLAEHIQTHGSIYTYDTICGVLAKLEKCIPELLSQGYKVKLEGLGTLKLYAKTKGEPEVTDFTVAKNVKKLRVRFTPEQSDFSLVSTGAVTRSGSAAGLELLNYYVESVESDGTRNIVYLDGTSASGGSGNGGDGGNGGDNTPSQEDAGEDRP